MAATVLTITPQKVYGLEGAIYNFLKKEELQGKMSSAVLACLQRIYAGTCLPRRSPAHISAILEKAEAEKFDYEIYARKKLCEDTGFFAAAVCLDMFVKKAVPDEFKEIEKARLYHAMIEKIIE